MWLALWNRRVPQGFQTRCKRLGGVVFPIRQPNRAIVTVAVGHTIEFYVLGEAFLCRLVEAFQRAHLVDNPFRSLKTCPAISDNNTLTASGFR
jgi:hypothetical protein